MVRNSLGVCVFYYGFLDFYSIFDIILRILSECRFSKKRKNNAQIVKNSILNPSNIGIWLLFVIIELFNFGWVL